VDFLGGLLPDSIVVAGLYGLERIEAGERVDHPLAGAWREAIDDVVSVSAARGPEGMRVESKGLSITLHYRGAPELADEVRAWADEQAARSGLVSREARMSVELHPPIDADKGTALLELASGLKAVCYIGDDVGDIPAFDALDALATAGVAVARVVVRSDEVMPELVERADLVLDGPGDAVALLEHLAGTAVRRAS
jgi:trehalose 6-phosphate phosphatase